MTGKTLPPFDQLKKPAALPPFDKLKEISKGDEVEAQVVAAPATAVNTHPKAIEAAKNKKTKEKVLHKRKKEAININAFASQHSRGHAMFFRHIRVPDLANIVEKWDEDLYRMVQGPAAGPKGGATIIVDMIDENSFTFAFSICNLDEGDAYVKDEARKRCQDRFREGQICKITRRSADISCFENISAAITNHFRDRTSVEDGPQLEVIGSAMTDDYLATLHRYIKKYGSESKDGESWPHKKH